MQGVENIRVLYYLEVLVKNAYIVVGCILDALCLCETATEKAGWTNKKEGRGLRGVLL